MLIKLINYFVWSRGISEEAGIRNIFFMFGSHPYREYADGMDKSPEELYG